MLVLGHGEAFIWLNIYISKRAGTPPIYSLVSSFVALLDRRHGGKHGCAMSRCPGCRSTKVSVWNQLTSQSCMVGTHGWLGLHHHSMQHIRFRSYMGNSDDRLTSVLELIRCVLGICCYCPPGHGGWMTGMLALSMNDGVLCQVERSKPVQKRVKKECG